MTLSDLGRQLEDKECLYQKEYGRRINGKWGKGIYRYEWLDYVCKMNEVEFPPIEAFENNLGNKVFEEDYINAKEFFDNHCDTFRDYHDYYLRQVVLILADALIKFRCDLYELVKMDLLRAFSLPQLSFSGLLLHSRKKIPYITDPTMYNIAESGAKGGLNIIAKWITEIKDDKKERIMYTDMKSMYVNTMQQPLPPGGYELVNEPTCMTLLSLSNSMNLNTHGALVTIDIVFPANTHDNLADFPPVFEKKIHTPDQYPLRYEYYKQQQHIPKLTAHLAPVREYTCTTQELLIIVNLGGLVTNVSSILLYEVEPFARSYLLLLQQLRRDAIANENKPLSNLLK